MRFQNVKAEELEGPIKLSGFTDWVRGLQNGRRVTSILLASAPGMGKGSAVGVLAETLHYDVVRCRLSQLHEYPDPSGEFRALLQGAEHLHKTVLWLDGIDRFLSRLSESAEGGPAILESWLKSDRDALVHNEVIVVGTARQQSDVPPRVVDAFDQVFAE